MGGLVSRLWSLVTGGKDLRILVLGLDGAGKTSVLEQLYLGKAVQTTIGFNVRTVSYKGLTFQAWDLGGQISIRAYWKIYYPNSSAVIYVVDSGDRERLEVNRKEVHSLLSEQELKGCSFLFLANKQDLEHVLTDLELSQALQLDKFKDRTWAVFPASAKTGAGLSEAMDWLASILTR